MLAANAEVEKPFVLPDSACKTIKMNIKMTEKSLSSLVNTRVRSRLLAVFPDDDSCPYPERPSNYDRRHIQSCPGFFAHAWMMSGGWEARLGAPPP